MSASTSRKRKESAKKEERKEEKCNEQLPLRLKENKTLKKLDTLEQLAKNIKDAEINYEKAKLEFAELNANPPDVGPGLFLKYHPEYKVLMDDLAGVWNGEGETPETIEQLRAVQNKKPDPNAPAFGVVGTELGKTTKLQRFELLRRNWHGGPFGVKNPTGEQSFTGTPEYKKWIAAEQTMVHRRDVLDRHRRDLAFLKWTKVVVDETRHIKLAPGGVEYIKNALVLADRPRAYKSRKRTVDGNITAGKTLTMILPMPRGPTEADGIIKFRVERDTDREFTSDGRTIVFTQLGVPTLSRYVGVIDPDTNTMYTRCPDPEAAVFGENDNNNNNNNTDPESVLRRSIVDIFLAISENAGKYFDDLGKKYGMCGICGLPLSVERSKEHGYGPDCAKKMGWPY
jgi:Family of unknown function (DUF6011)